MVKLMLLSNNSNEISVELEKSKRISKGMPEADVKRFLEYIDYFNNRIDRDTRNLFGEDIGYIDIDTRFAPLLTPKEVTLKDDSIQFADLMVREVDFVKSFEASEPSYAEWMTLQRQVLNLFKTSIVGTNAINAVKEIVPLNSIADRVQIINDIYVTSVREIEHPVKLAFNPFNVRYLDDSKDEITVARLLIQHAIRNMD